MRKHISSRQNMSPSLTETHIGNMDSPKTACPFTVARVMHDRKRKQLKRSWWRMDFFLFKTCVLKVFETPVNLVEYISSGYHSGTPKKDIFGKVPFFCTSYHDFGGYIPWSSFGGIPGRPLSHPSRFAATSRSQDLPGG